MAHRMNLLRGLKNLSGWGLGDACCTFLRGVVSLGALGHTKVTALCKKLAKHPLSNVCVGISGIRSERLTMAISRPVVIFSIAPQGGYGNFVDAKCHR